MWKGGNMQTPTDSEILAMDNVPVRMAAKYTGLSLMATYYGLQDHTLPFGTGIKGNGCKWAYSISPGLLVAYKRGTINVQVIVNQTNQ